MYRQKNNKIVRIFLIFILLSVTNVISAQTTIKCIGLASNLTNKCSIGEIKYNELFYVELSSWDEKFNNSGNNSLLINDTPLPYYTCAGINKTKNRIYFKIGSNKILNNTQKTIIELIRKDFLNYSNRIPLIFGVGLKNESYAISYSLPIDFVFFNDILAIIIAFLAVGLFITFFTIIVNKKGIDESPTDPNKSLRKFQLLFWTFLIVFAYFSLWLILQDAPVLPASVLGLLTISLTTTGISSIIEINKKIPDSAGNVIPPSIFGLKGLLLGANGEFSITRLQYFMFTLVFGVIFIYAAFFELSIYNFTTQQLALMGISSAGYLGMKALKA